MWSSHGGLASPSYVGACLSLRFVKMWMPIQKTYSLLVPTILSSLRES